MKKIGLLLISLCLLCGCTPKKSSETDFILNTVCTITLYDGSNPKLIGEAFALCREKEAMLSRTIESSDIGKLNAAGGAPVTVSTDTENLLSTAKTFYDLSGGKFDVTISPLSSLWDFTAENPKKPSEDAIAEAKSHVGMDKLMLEGSTVTLKDPAAAVDLGGIAKGYIADCAAAYLMDAGVTSAVLDLGGNIIVIGQKPDKTPFSVGVQVPFGAATDLAAVVQVTNMSVVTSGVYERYFEEDGIRYHHILDPATGLPADTGLQSVTILAPSSITADALSTTCFLLGLTEGMTLIESQDGIEAVFIDNEGALHFSSGMDAYLKK